MYFSAHNCKSLFKWICSVEGKPRNREMGGKFGDANGWRKDLMVYGGCCCTGCVYGVVI